METASPYAHSFLEIRSQQTLWDKEFDDEMNLVDKTGLSWLWAKLFVSDSDALKNLTQRLVKEWGNGDSLDARLQARVVRGEKIPWQEVVDNQLLVIANTVFGPIDREVETLAQRVRKGIAQSHELDQALNRISSELRVITEDPFIDQIAGVPERAEAIMNQVAELWRRTRQPRQWIVGQTRDESVTIQIEPSPRVTTVRAQWKPSPIQEAPEFVPREAVPMARPVKNAPFEEYESIKKSAANIQARLAGEERVDLQQIRQEIDGLSERGRELPQRYQNMVASDVTKPLNKQYENLERAHQLEKELTQALDGLNLASEIGPLKELQLEVFKLAEHPLRDQMKKQVNEAIVQLTHAKDLTEEGDRYVHQAESAKTAGGLEVIQGFIQRNVLDRKSLLGTKLGDELQKRLEPALALKIESPQNLTVKREQLSKALKNPNDLQALKEEIEKALAEADKRGDNQEWILLGDLLDDVTRQIEKAIESAGAQILEEVDLMVQLQSDMRDGKNIEERLLETENRLRKLQRLTGDAAVRPLFAQLRGVQIEWEVKNAHQEGVRELESLNEAHPPSKTYATLKRLQEKQRDLETRFSATHQRTYLFTSAQIARMQDFNAKFPETWLSWLKTVQGPIEDNDDLLRIIAEELAVPYPFHSARHFDAEFGAGSYDRTGYQIIRELEKARDLYRARIAERLADEDIDPKFAEQLGNIAL